MLKQLANIRKSMASIFIRMLMIAAYLGVLLSLFAIHRYLLLNDGSLASHIGFSFLNALALAKVILVGQEFRIGDRYRDRALIYAIVVKSAIFAALLLLFRIIEEAVIGAVEGKNIYDAILSGHPGLAHDKFEGMLLTCLIMFFALMPFFAYLEFERALGDDRMRAMMFGGGFEHHPEVGQAFAQSGVTTSKADPITGSTGPDSHKLAREERSTFTPDSGQEHNGKYQELWYYERGGEVIGPVHEWELVMLLHIGLVNPTTLVHQVSSGEGWRLLQETALV